MYVSIRSRDRYNCAETHNPRTTHMRLSVKDIWLYIIGILLIWYTYTSIQHYRRTLTISNKPLAQSSSQIVKNSLSNENECGNIFKLVFGT